MTTELPLFSPWDMEVAHHNFDAMCGHGALAASLGSEVCDVMKFFAQGGWVNIPMMEQAIRAAGKVPAKMSGWNESDRPAVSIIQFGGPWMRPIVPVAARCAYRHWVAVRRGLAWDANEPRWQTRAEWERTVIPALLPETGDGRWEIIRTIAII